MTAVTMGREAMSVLRGRTPTHVHLRGRLVSLIVISVAVDLLAGVAALWAERDAPGSQIHGWGDALFWTTTQLLTVSSPMPNPVTTAGRWLDVGLELYGVVVVATLAGAFGAFFHRRGMERDPL
jgi:hypothetical protein